MIEVGGGDLRLRGYTNIGATLIDMLDNYADALAEVGGRLYLSGLHEDVSTQRDYPQKRTILTAPERQDFHRGNDEENVNHDTI